MTKSVHVSHKGLKRTAIILMADFLSLLNVTIISLKEEETKALYFSMAFFFGGGVLKYKLSNIVSTLYGMLIFPLVSWVRCGTGLFRFLIFAPLVTCL